MQHQTKLNETLKEAAIFFCFPFENSIPQPNLISQRCRHGHVLREEHQHSQQKRKREHQKRQATHFQFSPWRKSKPA